MESATPPLSVIFNQISDVHAVNIAAAGALTWLVYDIALTASLEVSKWTFTKVLYCFIRYYTVFTLSINLAGKHFIFPFVFLKLPYVIVNSSKTVSFQRWFWFIGYNGPVLSTALGECLLLLRVNALYGYNLRDLFVLSLSVLMNMLKLAFTTVAIEISSITVLPRTSATPVPGCIATSPPRIKLTLAAWSPVNPVLIVKSAVFFILSLFKFFASIPSMQLGKPTAFKDILQVRKIMPTLSLFIRDNSFFFFLCLINLIFIVGLADRPIQQMGTAWLMAGYAVMASRLMLNMRTIPGFVDVGESFELDSRFQSRSDMRFALGITQGTDSSNHD
ncbi:hypothetical protein IW261DRAFT_1466381 [Armillaria novae-zelandiae]|uniref:DUF6533 domain-containing protein n=1 Tax=Armillaria novae-zelandiae TaxID=153914 RepID=A0AA39PI62_9AGAR|nr:hypothetical protein IW261DRAFT_1466381 [Armillaria novae-zelandiae]